MLVLALDTTGANCSAALVDDAWVLAQKSENISRGHAERLAPMVQEILIEAGKGVHQIDRIAVCTGPGSFTGLRVALSFAKGFALPRKTPIVGVSALHVSCAMADPARDKTVVCAADVRRGELCWAHSENGRMSAPATQAADAAEAAMKKISADKLIIDPVVSAPVLGWLAMDLNPKDYPAEAFYHRPPDAKVSTKTYRV